MAERIKLPLITGFRVTGFEPIYSAEIALKMEDGPVRHPRRQRTRQNDLDAGGGLRIGGRLWTTKRKK